MSHPHPVGTRSILHTREPDGLAFWDLVIRCTAQNLCVQPRLGIDSFFGLWVIFSQHFRRSFVFFVLGIPLDAIVSEIFYRSTANIWSL